MAILIGIRNLEVKLAGPDLKIFVTLYVLDIQLSRSQSRPEVGAARNLNRDVKLLCGVS